MPTIERTCKVRMPVDQAEKKWTEFASKQSQSNPASGAQPQGKSGNGSSGDPGTVYFNDAGDGTTEVTIQIDPEGIAEGDENTFNQRVDGFLQNFKQHVES
jgi:hypothetical protein